MIDCTFRPQPARPVPDFTQLQLNFNKNLEKQRRSRSVTVPEPFNFCKSKKDIYLRAYMDAANRPEEKLKQMSFAAKRYAKEIESLK